MISFSLISDAQSCWSVPLFACLLAVNVNGALSERWSGSFRLRSLSFSCSSCFFHVLMCRRFFFFFYNLFTKGKQKSEMIIKTQFLWWLNQNMKHSSAAWKVSSGFQRESSVLVDNLFSLQMLWWSRCNAEEERRWAEVWPWCRTELFLLLS